MQNIKDFNSNLGTAILLCGGAGSGKTSLAMSLFPKTYVFVADLNFKSGLDYLARKDKLGNVVGFDTASPDENSKIVPANQRYDRMFKLLTAATDDPKVDAIVLDSITFIQDIIKAKIVGATTDAIRKLNGFDEWGNLQITWRSLIMQLRQSGKKLVTCAHETKERDESDQIFKYQISADGGIRDQFPALFSDVWRCEVKEDNGKHTWNVRTLQNVRQEHLKISGTFQALGIPAVLTQDELVKLVSSAK